MAEIAKYNPDAFIMADVGVIQIAKRVAPNVPIHVSTQANTVNVEDVKFWAAQGAKRVVLARELTLPEIKEIHEEVPEVELEVFVHGAMCISYSGRCLMSNYMTGRHSNLGECAQPCRWNYKVYLEEQLRPGEFFEIEESERGTAVMSSQDLRLVRYLPEILDAGVVGLKIEGRNKSEYYVATAARTYREALDLIETNKYSEADKERLENELEKLNYRGYTTGFILGEAKKGETHPDRSPVRKWDYIGMVTSNKMEISVNNKILVGDDIEVLTPQGVFDEEVKEITGLSGNGLEEISPGRADQKAILKLSKSYPVNSFVRKELKVKA
jgi:putative protease